MLKWDIQWPRIHVTIMPLQERHFVTLAIFMLALGMFLMARENPSLWDIELFKIILQAVVISGIIGSILAFHFAANKRDEDQAPAPKDAKDAAREVSDAADERAREITEGQGR